MGGTIKGAPPAAEPLLPWWRALGPCVPPGLRMLALGHPAGGLGPLCLQRGLWLDFCAVPGRAGGSRRSRPQCLPPGLCGLGSRPVSACFVFTGGLRPCLGWGAGRPAVSGPMGLSLMDPGPGGGRSLSEIPWHRLQSPCPLPGGLAGQGRPSECGVPAFVPDGPATIVCGPRSGPSPPGTTLPLLRHARSPAGQPGCHPCPLHGPPGAGPTCVLSQAPGQPAPAFSWASPAGLSPTHVPGAPTARTVSPGSLAVRETPGMGGLVGPTAS